MAREVKVLELSVSFLEQSSLWSFLSKIHVDMDGQCRPIRTALPETESTCTCRTWVSGEFYDQFHTETVQAT